jgi:hypothetical protein
MLYLITQAKSGADTGGFGDYKGVDDSKPVVPQSLIRRGRKP